MVDPPALPPATTTPGAAGPFSTSPASTTPIRDVSSVFPSDQVVSGRVVQSLGSDQYVLMVRGRAMVASSQVPLTPDSVVRIQMVAGGETPSLRLVSPNGAPADMAELSDADERLQTLGLPAGVASSVALAAFEDAGAPLARSTLMAAVDTLNAQASSQETDTDSVKGGADQPGLAAAFATLARAGMPATPATLALAQRALDGALPNAAGALGQAQTLATAALADSSAQPVAMAIRTEAQVGAAAARPGQQQTAAVPEAAQEPDCEASDQGAAAAHGGPALPVSNIGYNATLRALIAVQLPDAGAGAGQGAQGAMQALSLAGVSASTAQPMPGGQNANPGPASPTLLKQLAAAMNGLANIQGQVSQPSAPASSSSPMSPAAQALKAALEQAVVQAVHETSAASVFKPTDLNDYDMVMGLPLQDQGQPTPTRLAVAQRQGAGGNTTYMRVDTQMSHLGDVSIRMAGGDEGPLVITVLANGAGAKALGAALPELSDCLQRLGITAGLRVGELSLEADHG